MLGIDMKGKLHQTESLEDKIKKLKNLKESFQMV